MKRTNNLDERQEQVLLRIEHNGCWLAFWGLLAALIAEQFIFGFDFRYIAGEWIVFIVLAIYLVFACVRNGIWDRHLKANPRTNALGSLVAAVAFGVVMFALTSAKFPDKPMGSLAAALIGAVLVFVACFGLLTLSARAYRKRQAQLEEEPVDADELDGRDA